MDLRNETVAITGGGRGIGRAIAERLAQCGAAVALIDMDAKGLEETRRHCEASTSRFART